MPKLSFAEGVRYFFPGLVCVFLLTLVQPSAIELAQEELSAIGFLLVTLVISCIIYRLYRLFTDPIPEILSVFTTL